jgi:signal transduction histidine kinase/DNA-binding response OmpR family regulator
MMKAMLLTRVGLSLFVISLSSFVALSQPTGKTGPFPKNLSLFQHDTAQVTALMDSFWSYRRQDPGKALDFADRSYEISIGLNYSHGIANSLYLKGIVIKAFGNYIDANILLLESKNWFKKNHDTLGIVSCLIELGDLHNRQSNYSRALAYLDEARQLVVTTGSREKLSRIYNMLGGIYKSQKQYDKALEFHFKSRDLNEEMDFQLGLATNFNNIGNVFLELKDYSKAKEYYLKSLRIRIKINDFPGIASAYNNLGLISSYQQNFTEAIDYHLKAFDIFQELKDKSGLAMSFINQANTYLQADELIIAADLANKGLELAEQGQFRKTQTEGYRILSSAYSGMNRFKEAYYYHKLFKDYSDSIQSTELVAQITALTSRFEIDQKEKEIELLSTEKERQALLIKTQKLRNNLMVGLTLAVIIVLIFLYYNFRNKKKINRRLEELNLIKSRFFANISHEFRTPLTLLLGPLEELLEDPDRKEKEMIRMMHRNASRLLLLDNQLLDLSKLESGKLKLEVEKSDIISAVKGMVMSFQSLAEKKRIAFNYNFQLPELQAYFDHDKLEKIVYNLLSNAFKFTPENGTVNVDLGVITNKSDKMLPARIRKIHGKIICLSVSDTGAGIASEHLPHIFDRFYQADSGSNKKFEGTGIGLSLTQELVTMHRGYVYAESELGKGTIFNVYLPIESGAYSFAEIIQDKEHAEFLSKYEFEKLEKQNIQNRHDCVPEIKSVLPGEPKVQILIVEDNTDMRSYIRDCFDLRYAVTEAENGKSGFDQATKIIPDIIITDLMMPEMDGLEMCHMLKTDDRTSHIPIILLTALASVEDRIKGLAMGADDYIAKPFNRLELQARAENLVTQRKKLMDRFTSEFRLEPHKIPITPVDQKFLEKLIHRIEKQIADPDMNVNHLIDEIHLSRSQLHRKLKALTGMSATEFIRTVRLRRAAHLLEEHFGSIAEVVYAVGFSNLSYFSKCFQKQYNMSPRDYAEKAAVGK